MGYGEAIAQVAGAAANMWTASRNRKAQEEAGDRDRSHAANMQIVQNAFARDSWHLENAYNSPEAQMKRLKAAGINPMAPFGNGTVANTSGSINTPPQVPIPMGYSGEAADRYFTTIGQTLQNLPQTLLQNDLIAMQTLKEAQSIAESDVRTDKMAGADTNKVNTEIEAIEANKNRTNIGTQTDAFDLAQKQRLADTVVDTAQTTLEGMKLRNVQQATFNSQMDEKHQAAMAEIQKRIQSMDKTMSLQDVQKKLSEMQKEYRQNGIETSDPAWQRGISRILESVKSRWKSKPRKSIKDYIWPSAPNKRK